jgi:hypothetical protein
VQQTAGVLLTLVFCARNAGEPMSYRRKAALGAGAPCWPQVSSSYGSFDLAGFAKPGAWHYRAWWLCHNQDAGRPPVSGTSCTDRAPVVKIVSRACPSCVCGPHFD